MTQSKKIAAAVLVSAILPVLAFAQTINANPPQSWSPDLVTLGQTIIRAVWVVFTILAVIAFIYAAILFLTSGGSAEKVQAARSAFLWGVAGVVVGVLAYTIVALVQGTVGAS